MCHLYDAWSSLFEWSTSTSASWDSMEGHLKTSLKIDLSGEYVMCISNYQTFTRFHFLNNRGKMIFYIKTCLQVVNKPLKGKALLEIFRQSGIRTHAI